MTLYKARFTGAVYLLYFPTVILATFLVGRTPAVYSNAANLFANVYYVAVNLLLYQMFKPVSRSLSLLAALVSVVGCAVQSASLFGFASPQSALPLFGLYCLAIAYLILKSTFLPRALGVLMASAGIGWLTFFSPALAKHIITYIEIVGIAAELSLMLWLLVMGVNVRRWNEQAGAAADRQR